MTSDQKLKNKESKPTSFTVVAGNGDIEIFPDIRLPHFDKETVKAYKAIGKNKIADNLVCYVCDKNLSPRHASEHKYIKLTNSNLVKLAAAETVKWGKEGEKFCFFYEGLIGKPLILKSDPSPALGWKAEEVMALIVEPFLTILSDMRDKDLVHGEIWPGNMYFEEEKAGKHIFLGDSLSLPPSYNLPFMYEPVERALSDPIGKGIGTIADDLYAFGVSLAVIMRTHDPMEGASKEEIIKHKIEKGTYSSLIGRDRFNGAILELLRGLLYDDAAQRWNLDDVLQWKDGRRLSPKQSSKRVKATRPILFNQKKYTRPELLAQDLRDNSSEATKIVESGDMEQWIERAIEDKTIKLRIEQLFKYFKSSERGAGYNDRVAALLASTLYPDCPVRYKNLSFHPAGFGKYFTYAYSTKQETQVFTEIIKTALLIQMIQGLKITPILSALRSKFDACRNFINQNTIGSSVERCLYTLDSECRCLSPLLENYYVRTPEDMMRAFEDMCRSHPNTVLFDRHVVAFLSIKDKKNIDPYFPDIRSNDRHRRVLGHLRVLATIQKRSKLEMFPHVAHWVSINLNEVYEQFHDENNKEKFKKKVEQLKKSGDLSKIAALFDDPKLYQSDINSFYKIMEYYKKLNEEKLLLQEKLQKNTIGQSSGFQVSALISVGLALLIVIITSYLKLVVG